jgi:hypothetical protein
MAGGVEHRDAHGLVARLRERARAGSDHGLGLVETKGGHVLLFLRVSGGSMWSSYCAGGMGSTGLPGHRRSGSGQAPCPSWNGLRTRAHRRNLSHPSGGVP